MTARYTADVKGGFWSQYGLTMTDTDSLGAGRRGLAKLLGTRGQMRIRELIATLNGVASGAAALKTIGRIAASSELGGVRTIETQTIISANTAAADITEINRLLDFTALTSDPTPVANLDGNPMGTR